MNFKSVLVGAMSLAAMAVAGAAQASQTVTFDISGVFGNLGAYTGTVTLDVNGGQAISGAGEFTGGALVDAPLVLITTATPGNETAGGASAPVGFRDDGGTDLFGADTAYPLDAAAGLLFDVNTPVAQWGQFPLLNLYDGGAVFTSKADYVDFGSLTVSNVAVSAAPEPTTWVLMLLGLGGLGLVLRAHRNADRELQALQAQI